MFDTFDGLPVHALVLHATVVLLPLMSLVTLAVAVVPRWRGGAAIAVAVIDAALIGLTWVTIESGEYLQGTLPQGGGPVVAEHAERGDMLLYFSIGLFAASLLVALLARRGGVIAGVVIVLALVAGAATTGWTVYTGDAGARAVWGAGPLTQTADG